MITIDYNISKHIQSKNVCNVVIPITMGRIKNGTLMYAEMHGFKHPVVITKNHFTLPSKFLSIAKDKRLLNITQKIKLKDIGFEEYQAYVGSFNRNKAKGKTRFLLTINSKIRKRLCLKERAIVEIKINAHGPYYARTWLQRNKGKSMFIFFPAVLMKLLKLDHKILYQIEIKKSLKRSVSNEPFYTGKEKILQFHNFCKNSEFDLHGFLNQTYARTKSNKIRKFKPNLIGNMISVEYLPGGGSLSKRLNLKSSFKVDQNFYKMLGLIHAEASKLVKKPFCFTNKTPQNVKYIIDWFEKHLHFSKEGWIYEVVVTPKTKDFSSVARFWSKSLKIPQKLIKVYTKASYYTSEPSEIGIMNLRNCRTLKEIVLRLLETVKKHTEKDRFAAGHFLSGVLAGDGSLGLSKKGSLNYVQLCFDPNKVWTSDNELLLYLNCLKSIGIPKDDLVIGITQNKKADRFIRTVKNYGLRIRTRKSNALGFGGTLNIFKYRSFRKLAAFRPFYPNQGNMEKFFTGYNKIDQTRVRNL